MRDVFTGVQRISLVGMPQGAQSFVPAQGDSVSVQLSMVDGVLTLAVADGQRAVTERCPAAAVWSGVAYRCVMLGPHDVHASSLVPAGVQWRDDT